MSDSNDTTTTQQVNPRRRPWKWIAGIAVAFFVGVAIGAAGESEPEVVTETATETVTETVEVEPDDIGERRAELDVREDDIAAREQELAETETELSDRAAELDERESQLTDAEETAAASTFGNGVFVVGEDIEPGEYRSSGGDGSNPVGCYYAWKSSTGSDADIVDNNIVEGQTRVTLNDGDVFESTSCEQWERVD